MFHGTRQKRAKSIFTTLYKVGSRSLRFYPNGEDRPEGRKFAIEFMEWTLPDIRSHWEKINPGFKATRSVVNGWRATTTHDGSLARFNPIKCPDGASPVTGEKLSEFRLVLRSFVWVDLVRHPRVIPTTEAGEELILSGIQAMNVARGLPAANPPSGVQLGRGEACLQVIAYTLEDKECSVDFSGDPDGRLRESQGKVGSFAPWWFRFWFERNAAIRMDNHIRTLLAPYRVLTVPEDKREERYAIGPGVARLLILGTLEDTNIECLRVEERERSKP